MMRERIDIISGTEGRDDPRQIRRPGKSRRSWKGKIDVSMKHFFAAVQDVLVLRGSRSSNEREGK
jgi:hypothetical protein